MNFALLLPAGLAALAALLLPLLIHLARRSEQRITDFAALRWLSAKPRPRRKFRFDERLLLLLRLLLLAALALLLAQPVLFGQPERTPWVVALPGIDAATLRDAADSSNASAHWLAPGFPELAAQGADRQPPTDPQPVASLLRELDATLPAGTSLTVLVPGIIDGADAQRPQLSRNVQWRIVPGAQAPAAPPPEPSTPQLMVRYAESRAPALRYLRASGAAWQTAVSARQDAARPDAAQQDAAQPEDADDTTASPVTIAPATQALDADADNLVWLAPGPLPDNVRDWIAAGGHALLDARSEAPELADAAALWRDADGAVLVRGAALGHGRIMQLTRELSPEVMPQLLEADFPGHLRALFTDPAPAPARVAARAYAPTIGAAPYPETSRSLSSWLIALIAALFFAERLLASAPRPGRTR